MKTYLFVLGRNFELSRTELKPFCEEILADPVHHLLLAENLKFENPRELPKTPEQIFLDRLGGTIRMAEVIGEFSSRKELLEKIFELSTIDPEREKPKIGISSFGTKNEFLPEFLKKTKSFFAEKEVPLRIENAGGKNLTSGQIFDRKLLKRGHEFLIWKRGDSFLLAKTMANQNLRNYTLRDRGKNFRDPKMGMLPPKLAQILINLANPMPNETVIDPFCGSGTLNIEAAITGFRTIGSDANSEYAHNAQKNFEQMAEKFRYEPTSGKFFRSKAQQFPFEKLPGVITTEGTLGENFTYRPSYSEAEKNADVVLQMWEKFFESCDPKYIRMVVLCLPCWETTEGKLSISEKLFAKIPKNSYTPAALFDGQKTFVYARPDAFVGREICVLKRAN